MHKLHDTAAGRQISLDAQIMWTYLIDGSINVTVFTLINKWYQCFSALWKIFEFGLVPPVTQKRSFNLKMRSLLTSYVNVCY